jgi:small neutral amino acid transporter SnatA (MarC family)
MESIRQFLSIVLGIMSSVGMPAIVAWLKQSTWPAWKKQVLSLLVAVALGAVTVLVNGNYDLQNLALSVTAIFTAGNSIYVMYFRETRANGYLENQKVLP